MSNRRGIGSSTLTALIGFMIGALSVSSAAAGLLPLPEQEILPNGLRIAWYLNDSLPVTDITLLIKSGFRDDPAGKSGTTELLAAALDRGAAGMSAQQIAHAAEMLGASRAFGSDDDTFTLGIHGLSPDAPALLDLVAKVALHPDFPDGEIRREHERILDRWRHIADYGAVLASLAFDRIIASGTPYARGRFLSTREFSRVARGDVVSWYHTHFRPDNAILMVVGRVDKTSFRNQVLSTFGTWKTDTAAAAPAGSNLAHSRLLPQKGQIIVIDRPELSEAQVRIGFRVPLFDSPEHLPLVVANTLIGEYFNSRLNAIIRDRLGLTYSIGSSFAYNRDLGRYAIVSSTRNEAVGQLIRKATEILRDLKHGDVSEDEVRMAKEYIAGRFAIDSSTLGAVSGAWLSSTLLGGGPNYLNEFVPKISAVTRNEVVRAIAKDFDLDHLVVVVAGDAKEIVKGLRASKLNSSKTIRIDDLL